MKKIIDFLKDEEGAALPEYALLVALIAAVAIGAVTLLGENVSERLNRVAGEIGPEQAGGE